MNGECFLCGNPEYHTQLFDGNRTVTSFDMCDECQNTIESGIFMTVFKKVRIEIAAKSRRDSVCRELTFHHAT